VAVDSGIVVEEATGVTGRNGPQAAKQSERAAAHEARFSIGAILLDRL
jgi:hypothetical protein